MLLSKDLTPLKIAAKATIDDEAEQFRLQFITPGSGQALTYDRKLDQAIAFMAGYGSEGFDENEFPAIVNEIGITAPTAYEVAQAVLNLNAMFETLGNQIERLRLTAKNAVDAAVNPAEIEVARAVNWSQIGSSA